MRRPPLNPPTPHVDATTDTPADEAVTAVVTTEHDKDTYLTAQTTPPTLVGLQRGLLACLVPILYGVQHAIESHQTGYDWGDSIESGVLKAIPYILILITTFTGFGVADQYTGRAKKVNPDSN